MAQKPLYKSVPAPLQKYFSGEYEKNLHKISTTDTVVSSMRKLIRRNATENSWWLYQMDERNFMQGALSSAYRTYYAYNESGNETILFMQRYDPFKLEWDNYQRTDAKYDADQRLSEFTIITWNPDTKEWNRISKVQISYSAHGDETEELYWDWNGAYWVKDIRLLTTYDLQDQVEFVTYQFWDTQWDVWLDSDRILYTYNEDKTETCKTHQIWKLNDWISTETYTVYMHNSFKRIDSTAFAYWVDNSWLNSYRSHSEYEKDTLLRKTHYEYWSEYESRWIPDNQDLYFYSTDSTKTDNSLVSQKGSQTSNYVSADSSDQVPFLTEILTQYWSGQWVDGFRQTYIYDAYNNIIQQIYEEKLANSWDTYCLEEFHYTLTRPSDVPTPVDVVVTLPRQVVLYQNYPNPFNPNTQIEYDLDRATHVKLEIFDITGRLVKTLVESVQSPGKHSIPFHAAGLASGVYFYRLQTGPSSHVKKMLLIK